MKNKKDHRFFILIGLKKISLVAVNSENNFSFTKEVLIDDTSKKENYETLEKFLHQNIFIVEKNLKTYVKDIFLIIDYQNFFSVNLSFKCNFKITQFNLNNMNKSLIDVKNQFKKTIVEDEIIHMMIKKFIINGVAYPSLPKSINHNDLFLEIRFICLQKNIIKNLKRVLSKYQISLDTILCYEYLKSFKVTNNENIFNIANNVLNGLNQNEIFLINKSIKNKGFFEKFFNFFN
jgi:hypothetical protein